MYQGNDIVNSRGEMMRVYHIYAGETLEEQESTLVTIKQVITDSDRISEQTDNMRIPYYKVLCTWDDFRKIAFKLDLELLRLWF